MRPATEQTVADLVPPARACCSLVFESCAVEVLERNNSSIFLNVYTVQVHNAKENIFLRHTSHKPVRQEKKKRKRQKSFKGRMHDQSMARELNS